MSTAARTVVFRSLSVGLLTALTAFARADDSRFLMAYGDASTGRLRFETPVEIDWHALARDHLRELDVDRPSPAALANLAVGVNEVTGSAEVGFDAPLDPAFEEGGAFFISSHGVQPIAPLALRGEASFGFDHDRRTIVRTTYRGWIVAQAKVASPGGFVYWSASGVAPAVTGDAKATLNNERETRMLRYRDEEGAASYELTGNDKRTRSKTIAAAVGFHTAGVRYVFIAWSPDTTCDEGCCQNDFQLFRVAAELQPLATNAFDCDL